MRIPCRQRWLLRRTDRMLRRSDPHLAVMLAIFAMLHSREAINSVEQVRRLRALAPLIWAGRAAAHLAGWMAAGACWAARRTAAACVAVRHRLGGGQRRNTAVR